MCYRRLGRIGRMASEIGLGAEWLERHNAEESTAIMDTCEERCPFQVPITERMRLAAKILD